MGIELSPAEMDDYLLRSPRIILCVAREGRAPLALPMWFGWVEGKILMDTALGSRKISAIRKNPLVSCLVESGEDYFALQAVLIVGQCEIIDDPEERRRLADLIFETKPVLPGAFPEANADPPGALLFPTPCDSSRDPPRHDQLEFRQNQALRAGALRWKGIATEFPSGYGD